MPHVFDRLATMLAGGGSRRDVLKYLGGLLGGAFLFGSSNRASADQDNLAINKACKDYCSTCPRPNGVHGKCIENCKKFMRENAGTKLCGSCTAANPFTGCVTGATCCPPAAGAAAFCSNIGTDAKNCGACGNACPTANPNCCAGRCTNTQTDANNCGACGRVCAAPTPTCRAGVCAA